ncbi:MAG TPA: CDP-alcohol phosphatidyltransferase family protein [Vicinamibacteria bacterium]|nr:CDP-alcohol phosphatidyltransferase family protein [Vicinamibacteria bacterium]
MSGTFLALALALGGALLSMAVFAILERGRRDADAVRKGSSFLLGGGDFLLHWFLWAIGPLERALLRAGARPDHMNALGAVLGLGSTVLLVRGCLEAAGGAIALAGVCDVLDGRLARARKAVSPYGKFIDSTLDRFVETAAFLGFAVYFGGRPGGALVVAAGLGGSLLVSYAQARGETVGVSGSGGLMQRGERLLLQSLGCLFDPGLCLWLGLPEGTVLFWVLVVIAIGALGTAVHRTLRIARRLRG